MSCEWFHGYYKTCRHGEERDPEALYGKPPPEWCPIRGAEVFSLVLPSGEKVLSYGFLPGWSPKNSPSLLRGVERGGRLVNPAWEIIGSGGLKPWEFVLTLSTFVE